jgi:hypothetical protein
MTDEAPKPTTYFHQTLLADPAPGGRYRQRRAHIVGTEPTVEPIAAPTWSADPVPDEPPLGFSVESTDG